MKDFEEDKNLREQVQMGIENSIELNHLKKVHKKMNLLRNIIISIISIIAIVLLILFIRYNRVNSILNKAYRHIKQIANSSNYILTTTQHYFYYKENKTIDAEYKYFYKDGKYKLEISPSKTMYYKDNSSEEITIFHDLKLIQSSKNFYEYRKGDLFFKTFNLVTDYTRLKNSYKGLYILLCASYNVRTDYFNGEECYVLKSASNSNEYQEYWFSKENYFIVREIQSYDSYYSEYIYSLVFDQVTDEDVDSSNIKNIYSDYDIKF